MELELTNDTFGIEKLTHPQLRTTPAGFSDNTLVVTQGYATFVLLTPLHPGLT